MPYHRRTKQIKKTNRHFPSIFDRFILFLDLTSCIALLSNPFPLQRIRLIILKFLILAQINQDSNVILILSTEADFYKIANKTITFKVKVDQFTSSTAKDFV